MTLSVPSMHDIKMTLDRFMCIIAVFVNIGYSFSVLWLLFVLILPVVFITAFLESFNFFFVQLFTYKSTVTLPFLSMPSFVSIHSFSHFLSNPVTQFTSHPAIPLMNIVFLSSLKFFITPFTFHSNNMPTLYVSVQVKIVSKSFSALRTAIIKFNISLFRGWQISFIILKVHLFLHSNLFHQWVFLIFLNIV